MSILGIIGDIVGIVAAVYSGGTLGFLAAGLLAANAASQAGWIGGSIGKFMQSGWGVGLTAALSLGAAYGAFSTPTGDPMAAEAQAANQTTDAAAAAAQNVPVPTPSAISGQVGSATAGIPVDQVQAVDGLQAQQVALVNQQADAAAVANGASGVGGAPGTATSETAGNLGINSAQTSAQSTNAVQQAVQPTAAPQATNPGGMTPEQTAAMTTANNQPETAMQEGANTYGGGAGGGGGGGLVSKALDTVNKNPGLAMMAGGAISGVGQGLAQENMTKQQIAAALWGQTQWDNPAELAQLQAAAAQPVTVPQGFLTRAQNVASLMSGKSQQTGPVTGVQPAVPRTGAGAAAPPATGAGVATGMPPVSVAQATPQTPVPILGLNQTPRGGMI